MSTPGPTAGRCRTRRWLRLGLLVAVVLALNGAGGWLAQQVDLLLSADPALVRALVLGAAALYVLLMAVPFMPGIEVGLALMLALGGKAAPLVYFCTVLALALGFAVGRFVPPRVVRGVFAWLHLPRPAALVDRLDGLPPQERFTVLQAATCSRLAPLLMRHRHLAVMALLNLPGNSLIGGGGGIALLAGMSGMFSFPRFIALTALAVAPVPLLVFLG